MWSSSPRDNWARLVEAVVKREQIRQLCHQDSITTASSSFRSDAPSHFSEEVLSVSSSRSKRIYVSPPRHRPFTTASGIEFRKNASRTSTWKLFSALTRIMKLKDDNLDDNPEVRARRFSLPELQFATDKFHNKNIIGQSSHGYLYKGRLEDGSLVAVKRLTADLQVIGTELDVASIATHRNVLYARGFCFTEKERLIVFPYMPNGSVASWLRERHESLSPLNLPVREKIALGAAKGLAYLHYECPMGIIHLDIKAANVLIDEDFEAVVANFTLAKFMDCYDGDVVTGVKGALGRLAPVYDASGKYSVKADVFGYGVFLLELITTQNSSEMLPDIVKRYYEEGTWKSIIDANLPGVYAEKDVEKLLQMALICTQTDEERRPSMLEVVRMLEVGNGLAERWDELYKITFIDENMEQSLSKKENMEQTHLMSFTMHELRAATNDFSDKIISKDGYNMVYKGWLTDLSVAVKRYISPSLEYYFQKNLDIGRISVHPNIVPVIGFCNTPEEQLLVFHWMHNGSVASWLRGRHESQPPLTWQQRKNIAVGVARGLTYLHDQCEKKIIHRNVKAANVLLDENFEAVVADFESAELLNSDENSVTVTTTVTGTIGHIAPEYLATGECSDKTDVFGYGAFLLELITGKETIDLLHIANDEDMVCADWVKTNYERRWELMVDKETGDSTMEPVVKKLMRIAVLCTQYDSRKRPKMSEVVRMLEVGFLAARSDKRLEKSSDINVEEGNVSLNHNPNSECTVSEEQNLFSVLLSRRNPKNYPEYHFGLKSFSLQELHVATDHFSHENILVKGGKIYKGRLADGFLVAIKRLMPKDRVVTFEELEISSIVSHRYVSNALGFCITKKEQLLVFPYMANGSVASFLRERFVSQHPLSWAIRYRTAIKVARGLRYLHHDCPRPIIHRDIKAANILLDEDFEAFISSFSLAIFLNCNDDDYELQGTIGHIAPEHVTTGKCSLKNDVFGYGSFLLELITGQRVFDLAQLANDYDVTLLNWVMKNFETMIDRDLEGNFVEEEVRMLFLLAMICRQIDPEQRPMMSEVVKMLEYGGGLAVCENYLANQLHKSSMQIMDDSGFNFDDDGSINLDDDDGSINLDDDEPLEPR